MQLPLAGNELIDRICLEFEDQWRAGPAPQLDEFLRGYQGDQRAYLLRELLLIELAYLSEQGQKPTREAYDQRFPKDSDVLSVVFLPISPAGPIYEPGMRVGPYQIERMLGSGSFGEV